MALALSGVAVSAFSGAAAPLTQMRAASVSMAASDDLKSLSKELNPVLGYYDPLNLAELNFWGQGDEATVGFLRHAEIKHGRVAMAAFVGYIVQSNGIKFPWDAIAQAVPDGLSPEAQWDAIPLAAKLQIIGFVGFLDVYSEHSFILEKQGQKHYMKGGKPGYFPTFDSLPHPVPLNLSASRSPEDKEKGLIAEINNGRLAMIGIMGFVSAAKVPGSVPALTPFIKAYDGDCMVPFAKAAAFAF